MNENGNTGKPVKIGKTRPVWDSRKHENPNCARDKNGRKIGETTPLQYLIIGQPETDHSTRVRDTDLIRSYTPTPETLKNATARNKNTLFNGNLDQWLEKIETEKNLDKTLKFDNPDFRLKTRKSYAKSVIIAKRKAEVVIRGRVKFRRIKRNDKTPPDYETFNVSEGFAYRFYFYNIETRKTVIRDVKTNTRARRAPTREIFYPKPNGTYKALKILLPLNKIVQLKPIKTVIYEARIKPRYRITITEDNLQPRRSHAKTEISIDYRQLARAEKRISKKWFKLLTDSLKDETRIIDLPKHLKKLRSKIIKSKAVTPKTLRSQKPITPRFNTVTDYNLNLRADAVHLTQEMRTRKKVIKK